MQSHRGGGRDLGRKFRVRKKVDRYDIIKSVHQTAIS